MIIERINNITVLYSEGDNKITNKKRTLFTNIIYLGKNDDIANYEEVPFDIWRNYSTDFTLVNENEQIKLELEALKEEAQALKKENMMLGDVLLDTDYRLLQIEIFGLETEF